VAGVGAAGSLLLVTAIYGVWRWRDLKEILLGTARESCMIMMIIAMAFLFTYVMSYLLEGLHAIIKLVILHLKNQLSIFQKDKTVMFSREEITSSTPKAEEKEVFFKDLAEDSHPADTEEEEVFELSSPMVDAVDSARGGNDEDIFNLEEIQEVRPDKSDFDLPEIAFADEEPRPAEPPRPRRPRKADEDTGEMPPPAAAAPPAVQSYELPVTLEIPDGPDGMQLHVTLKITLKKK